MENNDSPYIYEKPLRSARTKRSQRLAGLSALGLVGMVGVFGGTALANTLVAADTASEPATANLVAAQASVSESPSVDSVIALPIQSAKPKPNSIKVELPALPSQSFSNTSSATPSAGSYSGNPGNETWSSKISSHEEREDHQESEHDENDREEND